MEEQPPFAIDVFLADPTRLAGALLALAGLWLLLRAAPGAVRWSARSARRAGAAFSESNSWDKAGAKAGAAGFAHGPKREAPARPIGVDDQLARVLGIVEQAAVRAQTMHGAHAAANRELDSAEYLLRRLYEDAPAVQPIALALGPHAGHAPAPDDPRKVL